MRLNLCWTILLLYFQAGSQCSLDSPVTITDVVNGRSDTTEVILQVSGAINNNLSSPLQGLCAVEVSFRHKFMKELSIELLSPDGTKVVLTGGVNNPANTPFILWNVTFVDCTDAAAPDPGFSAVWENNQPWQTFSQYTGQYYPHQGCLADFDSGPVNGNWTVRCIDSDDQGVGTLLNVRLYFCDEEGILCQQCSLLPGRMPASEMVACQYDPTLANLPSTLFPTGSVRDSGHIYTYAIFRDTSLYGIESRVNLDTVAHGVFHICPFEFDTLEKQKIPLPGTSFNQTTLKQYFASNRICADVTDTCLTVRIAGAPLVQKITKYFCEGSEFVFHDSVFTTPGMYTIEKNKESCDTVFLLTLAYLDAGITLKKDKAALSCGKDTMRVTAEVRPDPEIYVDYTWSTVDGSIVQQLDNLLTLDAPGTYKLQYEVTGYGVSCIDTTSMTVIATSGDGVLSILPDSITCGRDTLTLAMNTVGEVSEITWQSLAGMPFLPVGNTVKIWNAGVYVVQGLNSIGCFVTDSIRIDDKRDTIVPAFYVDTLDCTNREVQFRLLSLGVLSAEYTAPGFFSSQLQPILTEGGIYTCLLTSVNGCRSTFSFEVSVDTLRPLIQLIGTSINCRDTLAEIRNTKAGNNAIAEWTGPAIVSREDSLITVSAEGLYFLQVTAPNGCTAADQFFVAIDTLTPAIDIGAPGPITCKDTLIMLTATASSPIVQWEWNHVAGNFSTVGISSPGMYSVFGTADNGCRGQSSILITEDKPLPLFTVSATRIDCKNMLSKVTVVPQNDFEEILWDDARNPTTITPGRIEFLTSFPGAYYFTIENKQGCQSSGAVTVERDISTPVILKKILDTLTCTQSSVDLGVILDRDGISYLWNGPEVYDVFTDSLLTVTQEGLYYLKITGANNCITRTQFEVIRLGKAPDIILAADTITCNQSDIRIQLTSSDSMLSFVWKGPEDFQSMEQNPMVTIPGIYRVIARTNDSCLVEKTLLVEGDLASPVLTLQPSFTLPCDGKGVTLATASASVPVVRYVWRTPDGAEVAQASFIATQQGMYSLVGEGKNGCLSQPVTCLVIPDTTKPVYSVLPDTLTCATPSVTLSVFGDLPGQSYVWTSPSGNIQPGPECVAVEAGAFRLEAIGPTSCRDTILVNVGIDTFPLDIILSQKGKIQCANKRVLLEAMIFPAIASVDGLWSTTNGRLLSRPDSTSVFAEGAGEYRFSGINRSNGCERVEDVVVLEERGGLTLMNIEKTDPLCQNSATGAILVTTLNGVPPYSMLVNAELIPQNQLQKQGLLPGTYIVEVKDSVGCQRSDTIVLASATLSGGQRQEEITLLFGDSVILDPLALIQAGGTEGVTWKKTPGVLCDTCAAIVVSPYVNAIYEAVIAAGTPCAYKVTFLVKVKNDIEKSVPNIFAPGGNNNRFYLPQVRGIQEILSLAIFDRWAENVYFQKNIPPGVPELGWDGTFDGQLVQPGVYVVVAECLLADGTVWRYKGDVVVIFH